MIFSQYVERYGAQSVVGRVLYAKEILTVATIENIIHAYKSEQKALNWATWAKENPTLAKILREVRELIND